MSELQIFTDGGSRGNPGKAASAFIVYRSDKIIAKGSKYLGIATNNYAEYTAVIIALEWLLDNYRSWKVTHVGFVLDSELVVRQLNKIYKVKNLDIKKLNDRVNDLIVKIPVGFTFNVVTRDKNKQADKLVNDTLDAVSS
jgi:ribonuclease HI